MGETQELKPQEKIEVATPAEQTKPGSVFTPNVDIFETEKEITLLADVPGVNAEDLVIDLRDNILTIAGEVKRALRPPGEVILTEYQTGSYYRQFSLAEMVDQSRIAADLKNGVLRLSLPKVAKATPRKITVSGQ
jgi:HSP20 family molecular chaperone IbpA